MHPIPTDSDSPAMPCRVSFLLGIDKCCMQGLVPHERPPPKLGQWNCNNSSIYILSYKYYSRLNCNYIVSINFVSDQTVVLFEMDITLVKG